MIGEDKWIHRSKNMLCRTCMYFVPKASAVPTVAGCYTADWEPELNPGQLKPGPLMADTPNQPVYTPGLGRCRRHAPTMNGWPAVFGEDWCGDHKLDENKI